MRALEGGPDGIELLAIGADRPEGGDGVPVQDWWTSLRGSETMGIERARRAQSLSDG